MNTNNLSTLRKHITPFYGDHLPEQIRYRDRAGREVVIPTHTATLDELAFAIQMASEEQSLASRRRAALGQAPPRPPNKSAASRAKPPPVQR